jgi:hypothetical protein
MNFGFFIILFPASVEICALTKNLMSNYHHGTIKISLPYAVSSALLANFVNNNKTQDR